MRRRALRWALLILAALLALMTAVSPAADVPVKVYDSTAACIPLCAVPAMLCAWGYLALSPRRRRDLLAVFGLNLLVILCLCRALLDVAECYFYYVPG